MGRLPGGHRPKTYPLLDVLRGALCPGLGYLRRRMSVPQNGQFQKARFGPQAAAPPLATARSGVFPRGWRNRRTEHGERVDEVRRSCVCSDQFQETLSSVLVPGQSSTAGNGGPERCWSLRSVIFPGLSSLAGVRYVRNAGCAAQLDNQALKFFLRLAHPEDTAGHHPVCGIHQI